MLAKNCTISRGTSSIAYDTRSASGDVSRAVYVLLALVDVAAALHHDFIKSSALHQALRRDAANDRLSAAGHQGLTTLDDTGLDETPDDTRPHLSLPHLSLFP